MVWGSVELRISGGVIFIDLGGVQLEGKISVIVYTCKAYM